MKSFADMPGNFNMKLWNKTELSRQEMLMVTNRRNVKESESETTEIWSVCWLALPPSLPPSLFTLSLSLRQQQLKCRSCSLSSALLSFPLSLLGHLYFLPPENNFMLISLSFPFSWSSVCFSTCCCEWFFFSAIAPWCCLKTWESECYH